eukprot:SAG31_NODE_96_length_25743_cov_56.175948_23_plen_172_part_00
MSRARAAAEQMTLLNHVLVQLRRRALPPLRQAAAPPIHCVAAVAAGAAAAAVMTVATCDSQQTKASKFAACLAPGTETFPDLDPAGWDPNWDGRAPPADASDSIKRRLRAAPTRHLLLIRHGQYDMNSKDDPPLTELGRAQATKTGKRLAKMGVRVVSGSVEVNLPEPDTI